MGSDDQTARDLWMAISKRFQSNKMQQAIYLSHATMTQGDLSISDYGQEMKKAADDLWDIGEPVLESTLVLNLLRGLNLRFINIAYYITGLNLDFTGALDQLAIKELQLANADQVAASTALIASSTSSYSSSTCRSSSSTSAPLQQSGGHQQQQHRCKGKGKGGSGGQHQQQQRGPVPAGPWVCFNP